MAQLVCARELCPTKVSQVTQYLEARRMEKKSYFTFVYILIPLNNFPYGSLALQRNHRVFRQLSSILRIYIAIEGIVIRR